MSCPLIGNGSLRTAFRGVDIEAVFGDGCFGSLLCDLPSSDIRITTERIAQSGILCHEIIDRSIAPHLTITKRRAPECRMIDLPFADAPILVRMIEAVDRLTLRILPSEGTCLRFLPHYKIGTIVTTIAVLSRTSQNGHSKKLLCLIPTGNLYFREECTQFDAGSPSDGILIADSGVSSLIFAVGDSLSDIIPTVAKLTKQLGHSGGAANSPLFTDCAKQWNHRLSVMNLHDTQLEEAVLHLLAHYDSCGKIIDKNGRPLPFSDTPPIIECLARLGFTVEAKQAVDRIYNHASTNGFTLGFDECMSCTYPSIGAPAAIAETQLAYYHAVRDDDFFKERLPLLIRAAMTMREECSEHLLCFGGNERLFAYQMLHPRAVDQASSSATLHFIHLAETVLDFVNRHQLRARKGYYEALTESSGLSKIALTRDFMINDMLWENNPRRLRHKRSPRFLYGICEVCGRMEHLERMDNPRSESKPYVCLDCIEKPIPKRNEPKQIPQIRALPMARGIISDQTLSRLVCIHTNNLLNGSLSPTEGSTQGILLRLTADLLADTPDNHTLRELCERLYEQTRKEGIIRAGFYPKHASPCDEGDPSATAACILGVLAAENVL